MTTDTPSTELSLRDHALQEITAVEAGLADLETRYAGVVFPVATTAGLAEARAARQAIREPRYEVERIRKAKASELMKIKGEINDAAERITARIETVEAPIHAQIKAEEDRKQAEKEEADRLAREALDAINARLDLLRNLPAELMTETSAVLAENADGLLSQDFADEDDVHGPAFLQVRDQVVARLRTMAEVAKAREDEDARRATEQAELDRRAFALEQAEADAAAKRAEDDRIATEQRAAADAVAQADRDRIAAEQQARLDAQQAELEKLLEGQRETQRLAQVEADRIAAEAAETARINQAASDAIARVEAERAEAARIEQERETAARALEAETLAIHSATLRDAANGAADLLRELGQEQHIAYRALISALARTPKEAKPARAKKATGA